MDYEKEYKSLVAKVKKAHQFAQTDSTKSVLEDILPQLRESEDERIRKKLYNTVMGTPNDSTWFDGTSKEAMLAWLEKHKEKNVPDSIGIYYYDGKDLLYGGNPATEDNPYDFAMSQQEKQKPVEWSEEDEDRIRQIERIAQQAGCTQKLQEEIHDWLKSLRPSWKPSEEQMAGLLVAIGDEKERESDVAKTLRSLYEQLKKL